MVLTLHLWRSLLLSWKTKKDMNLIVLYFIFNWKEPGSYIKFHIKDIVFTFIICPFLYVKFPQSFSSTLCVYKLYFIVINELRISNTASILFYNSYWYLCCLKKCFSYETCLDCSVLWKDSKLNVGDIQCNFCIVIT